MEVNDLLNSRIPWMDGWMDALPAAQPTVSKH